MNPCIQWLLSNKFGQALLASGWLSTIAGTGYMVADHQITVSTLHSLLNAAMPLLSGVLAGGGVHFIWNKTSKNGNGNGQNGATH